VMMPSLCLGCKSAQRWTESNIVRYLCGSFIAVEDGKITVWRSPQCKARE
jgi:hypothetical protein